MKKKNDFSVEHLYKVRIQVYAIDTPDYSGCIEFRSDLEYEPAFWVHFNHSTIGRFSSYTDAFSALRSHVLAYVAKFIKEDFSK